MQSVRSSNLELFRIITMLVIVAHHYVVNSGLMPVIFDNYPSAKSLFLLWFGWGGKTGINCCVLITGFFMSCFLLLAFWGGRKCSNWWAIT